MAAATMIAPINSKDAAFLTGSVRPENTSKLAQGLTRSSRAKNQGFARNALRSSQTWEARAARKTTASATATANAMYSWRGKGQPRIRLTANAKTSVTAAAARMARAPAPTE